MRKGLHSIQFPVLQSAVTIKAYPDTFTRKRPHWESDVVLQKYKFETCICGYSKQNMLVPFSKDTSDYSGDIKDEIFALLRCCAVQVGSCLPTFGDNLSIPSSRAKQSRKNSSLTSWILKMGPIRCPETSVNNYELTPHKVPENRLFLRRWKLEFTKANLFVFQSNFRTVVNSYFCDGYGKTDKPRVEKKTLVGWHINFTTTKVFQKIMD